MGRKLERLFDEYLVTCARAGDRSAFNKLALRWHYRLLAHAYRLSGERETAMDIAQEGWADIVRNLTRLEDPKLFPAWAYRIITRRSVDHIRRTTAKRRTEAAYRLEPQDQAPSNSPSSQHQNLYAAINHSKPKQQAVIRLFYLEELSIAEISMALSIPAGTVKTRLMHGRNLLRAALKGEENG